jgi:hypothetical protein
MPMSIRSMNCTTIAASHPYIKEIFGIFIYPVGMNYFYYISSRNRIKYIYCLLTRLGTKIRITEGIMTKILFSYFNVDIFIHFTTASSVIVGLFVCFCENIRLTRIELSIHTLNNIISGHGLHISFEGLDRHTEYRRSFSYLVRGF